MTFASTELAELLQTEQALWPSQTDSRFLMAREEDEDVEDDDLFDDDDEDDDDLFEDDEEDEDDLFEDDEEDDGLGEDDEDLDLDDED